MSIHIKLQAIQQELKAPKGQRNNFGNYNYRSCEDILEAVKPLLKKHECSLILNDELVNIGDRYYIKAEAALKNGEGCGLVVNGYAREEESKKGMDGSQITGACSSYARKYALNGLFLIDDNKDSDHTNTHGAASEKPKTEYPSNDHLPWMDDSHFNKMKSSFAELKKDNPTGADLVKLARMKYKVNNTFKDLILDLYN